jgi:hypothetical protein
MVKSGILLRVGAGLARVRGMFRPHAEIFRIKNLKESS